MINSKDVFYKTPAMVNNELGGELYEKYMELYDQGMSQTELTAYFKIKSIGSMSYFIKTQRDKLNKKDSDESKLIIQGVKRRMHIEDIEQVFIDQLGITLKEFLIEYYINKKLAAVDIAELIGLGYKRVGKIISEYGLTKSNSQARLDAMAIGKINQDEIHRKGRIARAKHISRSNKQDILIELIKHYLEEAVIQLPDIEIIVGYNEYCVIHNLEIDIPIIIFYKNKIHKIAIEYDGYNWHEKSKKVDIKKDRLLKEKNWKLIRVEETSSESTNLGKVEDKSKEIVNKILNLIKE